MIDVDNINTTYQYIIKIFVLNTMLNHVGMLWIIENNEQSVADLAVKIFTPSYVYDGPLIF